jgi:glutathione S-transferase
MKLYDYTPVPNPRRVRIFLAEKGIKLPLEPVDIFARHNRTPEFLKKNPSGGLPVLELDDGTYLAESVAICRYFEETHPEPRLMGSTPLERATTEMWNRRMELELFGPVARAIQHTNPVFKPILQQFPDYGAAQNEIAHQRLVRMDAELGQSQFVAGDRFTIADMTALVAIDLRATVGGIPMPTDRPNLLRWHTAVSARPSAKA